MKKIILSLFLFLLIISSSTNSVLSQTQCSSVRRSLFGDFCIPPLHGCSATQGGPYLACCPDLISCQTFVSSPITNTALTATCKGGLGIDTAIGCIPISDTNTFVSWILGWSIGVGGGIAFLLIVYGSFMIMTSQGIPDRLKIGKEILTSAITGLIMLIFGILLLNFIGFSVLGLDKL